MRTVSRCALFLSVYVVLMIPTEADWPFDCSYSLGQGAFLMWDDFWAGVTPNEPKPPGFFAAGDACYNDAGPTLQTVALEAWILSPNGYFGWALGCCGKVICTGQQYQNCSWMGGYLDSQCVCITGGSPILISLRNGSYELTGPFRGVKFDIDADGVAEEVGWTSSSPDDGFLVLDRNGNGSIDDSTELFGDNTPQPESEDPNGFLALAVFDEATSGGNGDGRIDSGDEIYSRLRIWLDSDHDGKNDEVELHTLQDVGIESIELNYHESRRTDPYGNQFRYRARVHLRNGVVRMAWDVFLRYESGS